MLYIYLASNPHFFYDLGKRSHRLISALTGDFGEMHVFECFLIGFVLFDGQKNRRFMAFRIRHKLNILNHCCLPPTRALRRQVGGS